MNGKKLYSLLLALLLILLCTLGLSGCDRLDAAVQAWEEEEDVQWGDEAIIEPQAIADYLFTYGELPDNFITKKEAQALGWDSSRNDVSDVAPGKSIGGDRFGNYDGVLPVKKGLTYREADANYVSGNRSAQRVVYGSDGRIYYTDDHYATFTELFPSK